MSKQTIRGVRFTGRYTYHKDGSIIIPCLTLATQGDTRKEALDNLTDLLCSWFEIHIEGNMWRSVLSDKKMCSIDFKVRKGWLEIVDKKLAKQNLHFVYHRKGPFWDAMRNEKTGKMEKLWPEKKGKKK